MYSNQSPAVVIDNGSGFLKAGLSGNDLPTFSIPTYVGRRNVHMVVSMNQKYDFFENDVLNNRAVLDIKYPIQRGVITDWDNMEKLWHHSIHKLKVIPEQHTFLLTETPLNSKANREKTVEIMFNSLRVSSLYLQVQSALSIYSTGKTTGLVLDSGEGVTHAVPISNGNVLTNSIEKINFGGKDLTQSLRNTLQNTGARLEIETARAIKEKLCYVANDYESQNNNFKGDSLYELPDHKVIRVERDRFKCPEALFKPSLISQQKQGIHQLVVSSISKTEAGLRKQLYQNIVLSGGNTMFNNLQNRLSNEVRALAPKDVKVEVFADSHRYVSAWIGGSIFAQMSSAKTMLITEAEYEQNGPSIVHKKCL